MRTRIECRAHLFSVQRVSRPGGTDPCRLRDSSAARARSSASWRGSRQGEKVTIVADTDTMIVAEALAVAALEITPEVVTTVMTPVEVDGYEPPAIVAAALLGRRRGPASRELLHQPLDGDPQGPGEGDAGPVAAGHDARPARSRGAPRPTSRRRRPDVRKMAELSGEGLHGAPDHAEGDRLPLPALAADPETPMTASWTGRESSRHSPTSRPTPPRWTGRRRGRSSSTAASPTSGSGRCGRRWTCTVQEREHRQGGGRARGRHDPEGLGGDG